MNILQPSVGDKSFKELSDTTFELVPRDTYEEKKSLMRDQAALLLDGLLMRTVRGQGAVDLAVGRDLLALSRGKILHHLGYVRMGDYARERLGIPEGTSRELLRLARGLENLPKLRDAVWSGEVEISKALAVLPVIKEDNEAEWMKNVRNDTVRTLRLKVKKARNGNPHEDEMNGPWEKVSIGMNEKEQESLKEALRTAREIEGPTAPKWKLFEWIAAEFLSGFGAYLSYGNSSDALSSANRKTLEDEKTGMNEEDVFNADEGDSVEEISVTAGIRDEGDYNKDISTGIRDEEDSVEEISAGIGHEGDSKSTRNSITDYSGAIEPSAIKDIFNRSTEERRKEAGLSTSLLPEPWVNECCAWLEEWTEGWSFLEQDIPEVPGIELSEEKSAFRLDDRLRVLARMREGWGEMIGRLALLLKIHGLTRDMQFISFRQYCNDRLGSPARAIEQRAWLERKLFELPGMREALRSGDISYSKALILARFDYLYFSDITKQIEMAKTRTCKELERDAEEYNEMVMKRWGISGQMSGSSENDHESGGEDSRQMSGGSGNGQVTGGADSGQMSGGSGNGQVTGGADSGQMSGESDISQQNPETVEAQTTGVCACSEIKRKSGQDNEAQMSGGSGNGQVSRDTGPGQISGGLGISQQEPGAEEGRTTEVCFCTEMKRMPEQDDAGQMSGSSENDHESGGEDSRQMSGGSGISQQVPEAERKNIDPDDIQKNCITEINFLMPRDIGDLLCDAIISARGLSRAYGIHEIRTGEAVGLISRHFIGTWKGRTGAARGKRREILERHKGLCLLPVCTLPAEEVHHLKYRSQGGSDEKENLAGACVSHHRSIHEGHIRVKGRAGEKIVFELGLMNNGAPREVFVRKC